MKIQAYNKQITGQLYRPAGDSHKGQNGKLLVIGGSELFHASIFWSAQVASKIVDLVHFTSPANENNELVRKKIKEGFWEGIVVDFSNVEEYIREDDCILVGPGMERRDPTSPRLRRAGINQGTKEIVDELLKSYPGKKWVVDGGALQEVDPKRLNGKMIITPHHKEWEILKGKDQISNDKYQINEQISNFSKKHSNLTILLKGRVDLVCRGDEVVEVEGGNAGMTKGGTGDVLAGLTAALYCKNDAFVSAQVASYVNKRAGASLAKKVGIYFNAGDLVDQVPRELDMLGKTD